MIIFHFFKFVFNKKEDGRSSIGRALVSKTKGWEFESLRPCSLKKKYEKIKIVHSRIIQRTDDESFLA